MCIAEACKRVSLSPVYECTCYAAGQRMSPLIRDRAAQLGIRLQIHTRSFEKIFRPSENTPSTPNGEWFVDYPDPSSFLTRHLRGAGIPDVDNWNISLVGITPAQARRLGVKGSIRGVPSIDHDLARCGSLTGRDRTACWVALDRRLSTEVVPWIPFLRRNRFNILGSQVAKWGFDQSTGMTAFAHVALKR